MRVIIKFPQPNGFNEFDHNSCLLSYNQTQLQAMRLMTHNFLMCNVINCVEQNYPLIIEVEKSIYHQSPFNQQKLLATSKKLDWMALYKTVLPMGQNSFPADPTEQMQNVDFQRKLHRILFDTHIMMGKLICPSCKREYPIVNGIPNMILNESEL